MTLSWSFTVCAAQPEHGQAFLTKRCVMHQRPPPPPQWLCAVCMCVCTCAPSRPSLILGMLVCVVSSVSRLTLLSWLLNCIRSCQGRSLWLKKRKNNRKLASGNPHLARILTAIAALNREGAEQDLPVDEWGLRHQLVSPDQVWILSQGQVRGTDPQWQT